MDEIWKSYPSIENVTKSYKPLNINIPECEYTWVAIEKIHGANFSIIFDGEKIICARRKAILKDDEAFYNHKQIISSEGVSLWRVQAVKALSILSLPILMV